MPVCDDRYSGRRRVVRRIVVVRQRAAGFLLEVLEEGAELRHVEVVGVHVDLDALLQQLLDLLRRQLRQLVLADISSVWFIRMRIRSCTSSGLKSPRNSTDSGDS